MKYYYAGILSFIVFLPIYFISFTVVSNPNLATFILIYIACIIFSEMTNIFVSEIVSVQEDRVTISSYISFGLLLLTLVISLSNMNNALIVFLVVATLTLIYFYGGILMELGYDYYLRRYKHKYG